KRGVGNGVGIDEDEPFSGGSSGGYVAGMSGSGDRTGLDHMDPFAVRCLGTAAVVSDEDLVIRAQLQAGQSLLQLPQLRVAPGEGDDQRDRWAAHARPRLVGRRIDHFLHARSISAFSARPTPRRALVSPRSRWRRAWPCPPTGLRRRSGA